MAKAKPETQQPSLLEMAKRASVQLKKPLFAKVPESMRAECIELAEEIVSGRMQLSNQMFAALLRERGVDISESCVREQIVRYRQERQPTE